MQAIIELQAHNTTKNIYRDYVIVVSESLFGDYSLICRYGRKSSKLRELPFLFENISELKSKFKSIIRRRLNSKSRIGINYMIVSKKFDDEFQQKIHIPL